MGVAFSESGAMPSETPNVTPVVAAPESTAEQRRMPAMFRSLRYRDFALFWTGNFLSNIGTWMQNLALGWQILVMTNSPFLLGLNGFLGTVPSLVFSLPGGAIEIGRASCRERVWVWGW